MANKQYNTGITGHLDRLRVRVLGIYNYVCRDVWYDSRRSVGVNAIKTVNIMVRSFMSQDLQSKACALTYRTVLAIVPALALLFAIGRGFGFQDVVERQLISYLPAQSAVLQQAFGFVDSYLAQSSGGIFVGVGIVFLLWTLISLLSGVESNFNHIWNIRSGRSLWRKATDYLAIFILLPVLMICSSGIGIIMTTSLRSLLPDGIADSLAPVLIDCAGVLFAWLFFTGSYLLIPNTRVKWGGALMAGVVVGTAFQALQWAFLSGQLYVSKYNAIYGSFSFVPLLLIWLQLVWLFTLTGALLSYAIQNLSEFNFGDAVRNISPGYRLEVQVVVMAIVARNFKDCAAAITPSDISRRYDIPVNLIVPIVDQLHDAGLLNYVIHEAREVSEHGLQPAVPLESLTLGFVISRMGCHGCSGFIPGFNSRFAKLSVALRSIDTEINKLWSSTPIINLL